MKKCPQCGREYDLSMSFCLDDGNELLYGPASEPSTSIEGQSDEPRTAILHRHASGSEGVTKRVRADQQIDEITRPSDLPADGGEPIVGRVAELDDITSLLAADDVRLVTLTGIGGTGKTRLATEVGRLSSQTFPGGVFFVELESVNDPSMVIPSIAHALGLNEEGTNSGSDMLSLNLRGREALLILDNFEQVIGAAVQIASLLRAAPKIKILITSREPLKLRIEREYRVQPLELPSPDGSSNLSDLMRFAAVQLFVQRAMRADPGFELTEQNGSAVAELCNKLDGLPLALELAAARTRLLTPVEILSRLDDRLSLLTGGPRDLPGRQRTMRAALEWSCELLDEDERRTLAALAVFEGGFRLEAAETVLEQGFETLDLVTSLTDKSLLMSKRGVDGELRFWMLQLVRDYAADLLSRSGTEDESRRRHAEYFLAFARDIEPKLRGAQTAVWLDTLETEHDNFRAALRWSVENDPELAAAIAASLSVFWTTHGHIREAERWLDLVLSRHEPSNAGAHWTLLTALGTIEQFRGDLSRAAELYASALETARALADQYRVARSLRGVAAVEYMRFDLENALAHTREALEITRALGDEIGNAAALARLGDIALVQGNHDDAARHMGDSLTICRNIGYMQGVAAKLSNLAVIEIKRGNLREAESHLREGLDVAFDIGDTTLVSLMFDGFAAVRTCEGRFVEAARIFGAARKLADALGLIREPSEEELKNSCFAELVRQLGDARLAKERVEGERMSIKEVAAFALGAQE